MEPQTTKQPPNPLVLGIVTAQMLRDRSVPEALWSCDGVELRADGLPPEDVSPAVSAFAQEKRARGFTGPVVFTLRLERDLGAWKNERARDREAVWRALPVGACDLVDLEVEEIDRIDPATVRMIRDLGAGILVSHHAFEVEPPPVWSALLEKMRAFRPDGVKFAVATDPEEHVRALMTLARQVGLEFPVSCVLGMGKNGSITRLLGPLLGCPLTYGYLGTGAVAPGQLSVNDMQAFFAACSAADDKPAPEASIEEWLGWSRALRDKVLGA